jgi:uncharacterized protein YecE (DUF72 family)
VIRIGTAGWSLSKPSAACFPVTGSSLERYASVFNAVEINSSFYRPHKPETYARWAASVPEDFRFAVKIPKAITHEKRLRDAGGLLDRFLDEAGHLGARLGPLLVQLPPGLNFDESIAGVFFSALRERHHGAVVCEPRHASWFTAAAEHLMSKQGVSRIAADPAPAPAAAHPGGFAETLYFRLHGSPVMYHSIYDESALASIATRFVQSSARSKWCVFDNTASGAALPNALALQDMVLPESR